MHPALYMEVVLGLSFVKVRWGRVRKRWGRAE